MSTFDNLTRETKVPSIQTGGTLESLVSQLKQILEVREGHRGSPLDANITWRELAKAGLVELKYGSITYGGTTGGSGPGGTTVTPPGAEEPDLTPPPQPTGLVAASAVTTVILEWSEPPGYTNLAYTEIWRSADNLIANAVKIGSTNAFLYADTVGPASPTYHYWVRFVSTADVPGTYSVSQIAGTTLIDTEHIEDLAITNAKIGNLAVDSAQIADLAVVEAKIGALAVTDAKIALATITGAKIANATITGANIGLAAITTALIEDAAITDAKIADTIQSTNYVAGTAGWRITKAGTIEAQDLNSRGSVTVGRPGNPDEWAVVRSDGKDWWYNNNAGFIMAHNKNYAGSGLSYSLLEFRGGPQALLRWRGGTHPDAASGVLEVSGVLTADAVNAVNTVNIAGQAVTFPNHSRATWTRYDGNYTVADYGTPGGTDGW